MSDSRIEELVTRLRAALDDLDWMGRKVRPRLRNPATDEDIEAYEKTWERPLPPTYKAFLKIANGMEGADQYDWAIKGATPVEKGESFDDVKSGHIYAYRQKDPKHPVIGDLAKTFVAGSDFDYQVVYFDPKTLQETEPKLRRVGLDTPYGEYPLFEDFGQFLEFVVEIYEDLVAFQDEGMEEGDLAAEEQLLRELASLLKQAESRQQKPTPAPQEDAGDLDFEPALPAAEPEPKISPEMQLAHELCALALGKLLDAELVELVEAPGVRENLEDFMLRKLLRSTSPEETMEAWIDALSRAREVEELYGTDDELKRLMAQAFEEAYEQKQKT